MCLMEYRKVSREFRRCASDMLTSDYTDDNVYLIRFREYIQHNMNRENNVAKFLCTLYLESAFSEFISVGLLKSAVELDIVTESDISNILKKHGDKRDYEWYMEDQCSCFLHDETIIKISEILQLATDSIENELGFGCSSV